jgi:hypothetical protein
MWFVLIRQQNVRLVRVVRFFSVHRGRKLPALIPFMREPQQLVGDPKLPSH